MKKMIYQEPTLKSFSLRVERGFQASQVPQTVSFGANVIQGQQPYDMDDYNQQMSTIDGYFN